MLEEFKNNPFKYLKTIAMDIVVVFVAFGYIFYQMLTFEQTSLNLWIVLAEAIMGIICGVLLKTALGENGFSKGFNSPIWREEEAKYNEACTSAIEYMDRAANFRSALEIEKRANYRKIHLQAVKLRYCDWFDEEGNYCGTLEAHKQLDLRQKIMLRKCIKVKIYVLDMFSERSSASEADTKREPTVNDQRAKSITKNTITAAVIAVVGVYFVPILTWNIAALIAATMQVSLWILFGMLQLYKNYNFVVQDKVAILKQKKELIVRFEKECSRGMHTTNPYIPTRTYLPSSIIN